MRLKVHWKQLATFGGRSFCSAKELLNLIFFLQGLQPRKVLGGFACLLLAASSIALFARAQNPDTMLPEQNLAKAREILDAALQALGGDAYLRVRDITRTGRLSQFASNGEVSGTVEVFDYSKLPDKRRREYSKRRNIIDIFSGDRGWSLDRGGVEDTSPTLVDSFQEALRRNVDHLLRFRLNKEQGLVLRYAGSDLIDMKQVDWVEVMDSERRRMRIAFDRSTHLPMRTVNFSRDPDSRDRIEEVEYFSNYHPVQGIQTPFHIERERDGRRISAIVYSEVQFNTGLDDSLFTRQSLEERWSKIGKKK